MDTCFWSKVDKKSPSYDNIRSKDAVSDDFGLTRHLVLCAEGFLWAGKETFSYKHFESMAMM